VRARGRREEKSEGGDHNSQLSSDNPNPIIIKKNVVSVNQLKSAQQVLVSECKKS